MPGIAAHKMMALNTTQDQLDLFDDDIPFLRRISFSEIRSCARAAGGALDCMVRELNGTAAL